MTPEPMSEIRAGDKELAMTSICKKITFIQKTMPMRRGVKSWEMGICLQKLFPPPFLSGN